MLALALATGWLNGPWLAQWAREATLPAANATYNLNDYAAFLTAARMIAHGTGPRLYQIEAQREEERDEWGARFDQPLAVPFVNPPWFALALLPLAGLPVGAGFLLWLTTCLTMVVAAAGLLVHWARPPRMVAVVFMLAVFSFVPFWRTMLIGQTSALVLFGLAAAVVCLARRQDRRAGLALALVSVKPQLIILPLLALVAQRRWRALATVSAAGVGLLLVGLPFTGVAAFGDYLALLRGPDYPAYENLPQMQSWRALVEGTLGLQGSAAILLNAAGMLAALVAVAWAWRSAPSGPPAAGPTPPPDWDLRMALTLLLTPLFTPHLHVHDLLIWLVPGGLVLHHLYSPAGRRLGAWRRALGFAGLWAGYLVAWPAWLLPEARLALVFSLLAAAWTAAALRDARIERMAVWTPTPLPR
ncbi:MAG TPA: glycosyltransferase family 87 protein [Chloroflexia bacterium]|nr:glycosyltransferase family 87 protein [Chloroflexia bacterium]